MPVIPRPISVTTQSGSVFTPPAGGTITAETSLAGVAAWLRGCLPYGFGGITLRLDDRPAFAYGLVVAAEGIEITGGSPAGVFYGAQTLRQLLPPGSLRRSSAGTVELAPVTIADEPRFGWRGVMLDVARHFMPVADVLRFIDLAAFHKLNVLHLHLTDDQGWRLEVPGRPRLTEVGSWRPASMLGARQTATRDDARPHGGFYTDDDLREIVAYAAERFVTVVPEVDMPGHMQAAIAAYPQLGNGFAGGVRTGWGISDHVLNVGPDTLQFCRDVLDHVCDLFPSELIGIGGDECPTVEWQASGAAAQIGVADHNQVQAWFTAQMAAHLADRGRKVFGWDEILAGGAPAGAVIAAWRGVEPTRWAARAGHDVVACPDIGAYLDYRQSEDPGEPTPCGTVLTLADAYAFDPIPDRLDPGERARVIGGQANIWTEHMESARRVDYMAYPRLCAIAEALWSFERDYADFSDRLPAHLARLDALAVNYRPLTGPRPWDARPDAPGNPKTMDQRRAEVHEMTADVRGERA